ncbi:MAG: hypothetical protein ACD_45C00623G0004 [uncultured bacterium]|nr:MAG: hypothetical protein ACD_45C00623G0004 [uncultured bacterium]
MNKTRRHLHDSNFDVYGDLAKIKAMLAKTTSHAKGWANEWLAQSFEDAKERGAIAHENVSYYLAKKPIRSLSTALLTGVIIGYFLHRK